MAVRVLSPSRAGRAVPSLPHPQVQGKRQDWKEVRREFARYLGLMTEDRSLAIAFSPVLLRELDVSRAVGKEYKRREDLFDTIFCADLGALVPSGRLEMLGRPREGSIVVPSERRRRRRPVARTPQPEGKH